MEKSEQLNFKISVEEFEKRLEAFCLKTTGCGVPRKRRDQHILFASIILILDSEKEYSEKELNEGIKRWLTVIGRTIEIDHVNLRRHLVDELYLTRDPAGKTYNIQNIEKLDLFERAISEVDPEIVIENALERRKQRKQQYLNKTNNS